MKFFSFLRRLFGEPKANWHVTHVKSSACFNVPLATYSEAVRELRHRFPKANIVQVDREWNVILFEG